MNSYISDSVGDPKQNAANRTDDVKTVQGYLNVQIVEDRLMENFLAVTGNFHEETLAAIKGFQRRRGLAQSGLIQPRDRTWDALSRCWPPQSMTTSQSEKDWLKGKGGEDLKSYPYPDSNGNATIGYGHLMHLGPVTATDRALWPHGMTRPQAEDQFEKDVRGAEGVIHTAVEVPLTQNQFDALISLVFNIGPGGFRHSTVRRRLNEGDYGGAAEALPWWHHGGKGLTGRRRNEQERFLRP